MCCFSTHRNWSWVQSEKIMLIHNQSEYGSKSEQVYIMYLKKVNKGFDKLHIFHTMLVKLVWYQRVPIYNLHQLFSQEIVLSNSIQNRCDSLCWGFINKFRGSITTKLLEFASSVLIQFWDLWTIIHNAK